MLKTKQNTLAFGSLPLFGTKLTCIVPMWALVSRILLKGLSNMLWSTAQIIADLIKSAAEALSDIEQGHEEEARDNLGYVIGLAEIALNREKL